MFVDAGWWIACWERTDRKVVGSIRGGKIPILPFLAYSMARSESCRHENGKLTDYRTPGFGVPHPGASVIDLAPSAPAPEPDAGADADGSSDRRLGHRWRGRRR